MAQRCSFSIDTSARIQDLEDRHGSVDDDFFEDLPTEDGEWQCHRRVGGAADRSRCVLHATDSSSGEVEAAVIGALRGSVDPEEFVFDGADASVDEVAKRFVGARTDRLDLANVRSSAEGTHFLDFRCTEIDRVVLDEAELTVPVVFDGATLGTVSASDVRSNADLRCRYGTVTGDVDVDGATLEGAVDFRFSTVDGNVTLDRTTAGGRFDFGFTTVGGTLSADKGACSGRFTIKEASVGSVNAPRVEVSGPDPKSSIPGLQFRGLSTEGNVDVSDCRISGHLIGYKVDVGGDFDAAEAVVGDGVLLGTEDDTELREAHVQGRLDFSEAEVDDEFKMVGRTEHGTNPVVGRDLDLSGATLERLDLAPELASANLDVVDLGNATVEDGTLGQPMSAPPIYFDLREATLGTVDFAGEVDSIADHVWFDRTDFEGFHFSESRTDFAKRGWRIHDVPDGVYESIAVSRQYDRATALATDCATILAVQPRLRAWLSGTDGRCDPASMAGVVFEALTDEEVTRIAHNGPETADVLGEEVFDRERYRVGVATLLARESRGRETDLRDLLASGSDELRTLAAAYDEGAIRDGGHLLDRDVSTALDGLIDRFAEVLARGETVAPSTEHLEMTYIKARKGADDVGDSIAAANFFTNELRIRRRRHRERVAAEPDLRTKLGAVADYCWNYSFDLISGYGERPRRVFGISIGTVGAFAAAYWYFGRTLSNFTSTTYDGPVGAVLLSLESFTALVLGGARVEPVLVRLLADVEAFLGAFLIALLVFTLTRSLHR